MATVTARERRPRNRMTADRDGPDPDVPVVILRRLERFTVQQFLKMVDDRIFPSAQRVELLDGLVFHKMTQNPPHAVVIELIQQCLRQLLPHGWHAREQKPIRIPRSLPEPDLAVVRGHARRYAKQHPRPQDIAMLIEVADTSLAEDRGFKGSLYARARIALYWIINIPESTVEVYADPRAGKQSRFQHRQDYDIDDAVPVVIEGCELGRIAVRDLLP